MLKRIYGIVHDGSAALSDRRELSNPERSALNMSNFHENEQNRQSVAKTPSADEKALGLKLMVLDVDGVLTDGRVALDADGREIKAFDVKDGLGLKRLMRAGIEVALVTGRASKAVSCRAAELGIEDVFMGIADKKAVCRKMMAEKGLCREAVCAMGDDLPDLAMFEESGLCIAVADAAREVRGRADYITRRRGGQGAVREAAEWILKCRGQWPKAA